MGSVELLRHKDEVLRAHCDAVGRDTARDRAHVGCKPIIRDTEAEARRVWEAQMAHNRTPMADGRATTTRSGSGRPSRSRSR